MAAYLYNLRKLRVNQQKKKLDQLNITSEKVVKDITKPEVDKNITEVDKNTILLHATFDLDQELFQDNLDLEEIESESDVNTSDEKTSNEK